jgi:phosphatidylglycerophosphate synthase
MTAARISVKDVRASFNSTVKNHYSVSWFGRPLANLMTPFFYNSGWTANGVTNFRIAVAAAGVVVLAIPGWWTAVTACFVFYLCFVLDCVDGNLARLRGAVTYWGKFIDGLADFVFVLGAPVAAGLGAAIATADPYYAVMGCLITIASLTSQMVRNRLSFFREWMVGQSGQVSEETMTEASTAKRWQGIAAFFYVNGTFFLPLLLVVPNDGRGYFLIAAIPLMAVAEIMWLIGTMMEARVILERGRKSIHSAIVATPQPPVASPCSDD